MMLCSMSPCRKSVNNMCSNKWRCILYLFTYGVFVTQYKTRHGVRSHANAKNIVDIVNDYSSSAMDQFKPPGTLSFDGNVAENYRRWLQMFEIAKLQSCTSSETITMLKSMFARHGIPDEVVSDNGPQYSSLEFKAFALSWEFTHITTSPGFAQSNGQAERTVQTVKNILKKAAKDKTDPYLALLAYRNSPIDGVGLSPSQLLMSRRTKSKLPTSASLLKPSVRDGNDIHDKLRQRQDEQKRHHDVGAHELPPLRPGDTVRIRQPAFRGGNWDKTAIVSTNHNAPRSYIVTTPDGRKYRRNRRQLLRTSETSFRSPDVSPEVPDDIITPTMEPPPEPPPAMEISAPHPNIPPDGNITPSSTNTTRSGRVIKQPIRYRDY